MDSRSPIDVSHHTSEPSAPSRRTSRGDQRHQPQHSFPSNSAPFPSDENTNIERSSSRRNKGGGQDYTSDLGYFDVLPAAPDVPRASRGGSPISYRDPCVNGDLVPEVDPSPRSFSARKGTGPNDVDPDLANSIALNRLPIIESRRQPQYSVVDRSKRNNHPQVEQSGKPLYSSSGQGSAPIDSIKRRASDRRPTGGTNTTRPKDLSLATSPQVRSATSRTSAASQADWAADRSPLQKLEVKLNDISKEEKRARVQEAEQQLRNSQALASSHFQNKPAQSTLPRVSSQRNAGSQRATKHGKQEHEARKNSTQLTDNTSVGGSYSDARGAPAETVSQRRQDSFGTNDPPLVGRPSPRTTSQSTPSKAQNRSVRKFTNDAGRNEDRGVRFEADLPIGRSTDNSPHDDVRAKIRSPNESLNRKPIKSHYMTSNKLGSGTVDESAADRLDVTDPVPPQAVKSHNHAPKYEIPPQTTAGIDTRQKIGFGSRLDEATNIPTRYGHHLSDILHRNRHDKQYSTDPQPASSKHLDEWREGGTARLTLAGFAADAGPAKQDNNKAWWEEQRSAGQRRKGQVEPREADYSPSDGTYEDNTGMQILPLHRRASSIATARDTVDPVRARQYIGYEGTERVRRRNRIFWHDHESIMGSHTESGLQRTPSSFYSYSCPHLSEHDPLHKSHICQPYLSKGLIKSMRCIRVRFPADPTAFNPPLLLKCGPLLRYTGLRRDKIDQPGSRISKTLERETWRGSIMIVTTDAQSQYTPVPTLRLFHQPMKLLPPPPQQIDGESGDETSSEYVDPIAGLPKLTRTGGTVYVKPVEDLEEGKDVSRIENDDGLYEETRTANVPTSYGKADELLGRSPLPSLSRNRLSQQERQRSGRWREVRGTRLHAERGVTFWRFNFEVELGDTQARIAYRINHGASVGFWVPARGQTMNIMFHSCNGFSMSVE